MLFLKLFLVFTKIGAFNFGGGYAMLSLIHNEVVEKQGWLTATEFTDIVAISQSTPGPIGINCATYTGYNAVLHAGMPEWAAVLGAVVASLSVMWVPFLVMIFVLKLIARKSSTANGQQPIVNSQSLRLVVIGLIGAAAVLLMNKENFGSPTDDTFQFVVSIVIFLASFFLTKHKLVHPILMILICGAAGLIVF